MEAGGSTAAGLLFGISRRAKAASRARIQSIEVISQRPQFYHGWPTVTRRRNGELLVVCSGGREAHVCPFGWVEMMRSPDEGRHWNWPRVLMDTAIDDRDAGVCETARGSLLVTTFTSLAYQDRFEEAEKLSATQEGAWSKEKLRSWRAAHERTSGPQRERVLATWMIRSTDSGATWSAPYRCPVNSPHGPISLSDGRVLYAEKQLWHGTGSIGVCESTDDGQSWRWLAEIPTRSGDDNREYHELHAVETSDGRLIAHIRNHNKANERETLQSESTDGGRSWSVPHSTGVWGLPSHLLRLGDGRLLMSYGYRREPFGNQARVSHNHGKTWSDPITLSDDGVAGDLGYPSTVELGDSTLLTVWYEKMRNSPNAVLRQAKWRLGAGT